MCAARLKAQPGRPGRCVLRSVAEQLRQPWAEPYRSLLHRLAPLAREAGVPLIEQFEGTWAGAAAGLLQHHDSTRIHFSDTGAPHPNRPSFLPSCLPACLPAFLPSFLPSFLTYLLARSLAWQAAYSSRSSPSTRCRSCCRTARCRRWRGRGSCGCPMYCAGVSELQQVTCCCPLDHPRQRLFCLFA